MKYEIYNDKVIKRKKEKKKKIVTRQLKEKK